MQRNDGVQTHDQTPHERIRMTVPEAATRLGISAEAVRARIHRGTLEHTKEGGTVYVLLTRHDVRHYDTRTHYDAERAHHNDDARTHHNAVIPAEAVRRLEDHNADLKDQVENLQRELEVRNDELRRKDHLLAAALERIPAIEPPDTPSEQRDAPVTASEETGKGDWHPRSSRSPHSADRGGGRSLGWTEG
jgi:excisionase family DNA binding protein